MTAFRTLCKLLEESGAKVTFSINCCSGIVSILKDGSTCQCWRCRESRGEPHDESTEEAAAALSIRAQKAMRESVPREQLSKKETPHA